MDYLKLANELLRKMRSLQRAQPQKRINEFLQGEAFVIQYIARQDSNVLPSEISNEMNISSARIAAALNNLEGKGLITRQIDKSDRRRVLVSLTKAGEELAEEYYQMALEETAGILGYLGERDAKEYVRIMGRLADMPQK